jgi:protocatechuate 3,4-dioxygenase beta subunit
VNEASAATRVELGSSKHLKLADLMLPVSARTILITGTVRDQAGRPIAGVTVDVLDSDNDSRGAGYAITDRNGTFRLSTVAGRYRIAAHLYIREGELGRYRSQKLPPFQTSTSLAPFEITLPD